MSSHGSEPPNSGAVPVVRNIFDVSSEFLGQYKTWLEQNPPSIPVTQILGFTQFTVQVADTVGASSTEQTNSTTFTDLATTGPTLTGLPDGKYVIFFGCASSPDVDNGAAYMGINVNSTVTSVDEAAQNNNTFNCSVSRVIAKTLSNGGNNTLTAKYASASNLQQARFIRRWMIALRYANA